MTETCTLQIYIFIPDIISAAAETFRPLYKKKKPVKFVEEWVKEMQLESSEAMRKLLQMTVFYGSMQEYDIR